MRMFFDDCMSEGFEAVGDLSPEQLDALERRRQSVTTDERGQRAALRLVGPERERFLRGARGR
jgi:hypothetical protein